MRVILNRERASKIGDSSRYRPSVSQKGSLSHLRQRASPAKQQKDLYFRRKEYRFVHRFYRQRRNKKNELIFQITKRVRKISFPSSSSDNEEEEEQKLILSRTAIKSEEKSEVEGNEWDKAGPSSEVNLGVNSFI